MVRLNRLLYSKTQFFYIADLIKLRILYTSPQVLDITGLEPEKFDLSYDFNYTHPSDIWRRSRIRAKVIETGQDFHINKSGEMIFSSNFSVRKVGGEYANLVVQAFLFYSGSPSETVYILVISTPKDWPLRTTKRGYYHWYSGNDMSCFRYPDDELMQIGSNISYRELEVIEYIHKGMGSKEIGDKLCLSPYTIQTHRKNIMKKTGKSTMVEVIYELERIGMI